MGELLAVVWDVAPDIFKIGTFELRYYGLGWMLAFVAGWIVFDGAVKKEGYPSKVFDTVFWYGVIMTIVGARLGHCLFYEPEYYLANPWQILNIRQGGLASHGAALGMLLGLWLFSRRCKIPYLWSLDRVTLPVTIGGGFVRLGNLMNSEIYGVETDMPWGFIFVRAGETVAKHPTQIYEAICYFITFAVLAWLYYGKDMGRKRPGLMFGVGLLGIFVSRFFIEFIKNPQEGFDGTLDFLLMGQWLSIPFIILGAWMVVRAFRRDEIDPTAGKKSKNESAQKNKSSAIDNIKPKQAK